MRYYLLFILLLVVYTSNAQREHLLNKTFAQRCLYIDTNYHVDGFWNEKKEDAYKAISIIENIAKESNDIELLLEARWIKLRYNNPQYTAEQYADTFHALIEEVNRLGILQLQIRLNYERSKYYFLKDDYSKAFEHQIKYYNLLQNITQKEFPIKKRCLVNIGGIYYVFGDYKKAKKYLVEALPLNGVYRATDDIDMYNTLGLIMRQEGKYDSAIIFFSKAKQLAKEIGNNIWPSIVDGNIGITYYMSGNKQMAKPLLIQDVENSLARKDSTGMMNSSIKLIDIFIEEHNYEQAWELARLARLSIEHAFQPYEYYIPLYQLFNRLYKTQGDYKTASTYVDSIASATDSLIARKSVMLLAHAEYKVQAERHEAELTTLAAKKEVSIQKRNGLIGALCFLMIIFSLLLSRQRIKQRKVAAEKNLIDNKLINAQKRLADFTKTIQKNNQLLEASTQEINKLRIKQVDSEELPIEVLHQLQKSTILTDEEWNEFKDLFEQVHGGFLYRLKEKLPNLTPAETRFVALSKLKLGNKEMANILGISHSSIRNYKFRLRKREEFTDDNSFQEFIDNI